ncbi:hypothetical protein FACS189499_10170 [Clostridia bacterium]|nr:hypothetical protein FACS189499_10170 [Clostridia bacterium]
MSSRFTILLTEAMLGLAYRNLKVSRVGLAYGKCFRGEAVFTVGFVVELNNSILQRWAVAEALAQYFSDR